MCFEIIVTKDDSVSVRINKLMSNKGVCRSALVTPGLLRTYLAEPAKQWAALETPPLLIFLDHR